MLSVTEEIERANMELKWMLDKAKVSYESLKPTLWKSIRKG